MDENKHARSGQHTVSFEPVDESVRLSDVQTPRIKVRELSDNTRREIIHQKVELKDKKYDNTWNSCCFTIDKRMVQFVMQSGIGIGLICFCSYQISYSDNCEQSNPYWSLLGALTGYIFKGAIKGD